MEFGSSIEMVKIVQNFTVVKNTGFCGILVESSIVLVCFQNGARRIVVHIFRESAVCFFTFVCLG